MGACQLWDENATTFGNVVGEKERNEVEERY